MIRINLAPKRASETRLNRLIFFPWKRTSIVFFVGVILFSVWLLRENQLRAGKIVQLQTDSENLQRQLNRLEVSLISLRALQDRDAILKIVKSSEAQWAPRLSLLADALVPQVWFTYLYFGLPEAPPVDKAPTAPQPPVPSPLFGARPVALAARLKQSPAVPVLVLKGSAFVPARAGDGPVTQFLQGLKEYPDFFKWFSGIELRFVEHRHIQKEEISDFEIALKPKGI